MDWRLIFNNDGAKTYLNNIITQAINSPFVIHADNPARVVRDIEHAVMSTTPHLHYRPGWQGKLIFYVFYWLPIWLSDYLLAQALYFTPDGIQNQLDN